MLAFLFRISIAAYALFGLLCGSAFADQVRISNLSNVNVPSWVTGDPDIVQDVFVCIYRENNSGSDRSYAIEAIGDGPGFFLNDGGQSVAYTLTWNDGGEGNPGGGASSPMVDSTKLTGRDNARIKEDTPANSDDCNGGSAPTARLRLSITSTVMDGAPDGDYSGTITLILSLS